MPLTTRAAALPPSALDKNALDAVRKIGSADLMVGIPSFGNAETIGYVVRAASAGMVQYFPDLKTALINADGGSRDGTPDVVVRTESPDYVERILLVEPRYRLQRISLPYRGLSGKGTAVRALLEIASLLKVKAMVMVDSDLRSIVPEWIELLAGPILKGGYDFVVPLYARHKFDGTITNSIAYPLTRALYGSRIRQPIGGDFGISGDLVDMFLTLPTFDEGVARFGIDIWLTQSALNEGYAVCQARLGAKIHDPKDPAADLGPMFRQVVGTLFRLAKHYRTRWQTVRGSHAIPVYGFERVIQPADLVVNRQALIDNFEAARLTLWATWEEMLAPEQLDRLGAIDCDDPELFRFPDELWVRCLYDTLVAFHRPGCDQDKVLAALTPLYFARTAAYVAEAAELTGEQAERVVEAQATTFEELKPYLERNWREAFADESAS